MSITNSSFYGFEPPLTLSGPAATQAWNWVVPAKSSPYQLAGMTITLLSMLAPLAVMLWRIFFPPLVSPFRHLPAPKQGPALFRIFHEPGTEEIERYVDEVPNKGLIRYYGTYNRERLLVTSPAGAKDLLHHSA
ncbi:Hypothetical protein D9617_18g034910 [Elsinoe fawcettii]|nr:Hypothetical protein D9617_18g034910 [Elsinoe fawcettii]